MQTLADVREGEGKTWVYLSGPNPFIQAGEAACKASGRVVWGTVEYLSPRQGRKMYEIKCIWVYVGRQENGVITMGFENMPSKKVTYKTE